MSGGAHPRCSSRVFRRRRIASLSARAPPEAFANMPVRGERLSSDFSSTKTRHPED